VVAGLAVVGIVVVMDGGVTIGGGVWEDGGGRGGGRKGLEKRALIDLTYNTRYIRDSKGDSDELVNCRRRLEIEECHYHIEDMIIIMIENGF